MIDPTEPPSLRLREPLALQELRYRSTQMVSRELLTRIPGPAATARYSITDAHVESFLRNQLLAAVEMSVLAHQLPTEDVTTGARGYLRLDPGDVPRSALVELPRTWWQRLLRRPPRRIWCPVVGDAVIHAERERTVEVLGTATVPVKRLRTFPQADPKFYPDGFGDSVHVVQVRAGSFDGARVDQEGQR